MKSIHIVGGALVPLLFAACATVQPPASVPAGAPPQWYAPLPSAPGAAQLPHSGSQRDLALWWRQQGDPLLAELIEAAQSASPSVATARSRIEQARATRVAAGAALLPSLDGSLAGSRSSAQAGTPIGTSLSAAVQAAWEIDVFGGNRANRTAAQERFDGAQAGWHEARVSIAAEVANRYYSLRACEKLLTVTRSDALSRAETSRLVELTTAAGFEAPAVAALARASAAEASGRATQQLGLCDLDIKVLVALAAVPEPDLRQRLTATPGELPHNIAVAIPALPAQTLAQRPDVFAAERDVAAASADVGSAEAQRYPRLGLSGSVGLASFSSGSVTTDGTTWTIGPLSLTLPLFDGGKRQANVEAARARYDDAAAKYRASVRQAVREVEEALVNLQSTAARSTDAAIAAEGYRASFNGTQSRYDTGLASLVELEESRRTRLAAEIALVSLRKERVAAWIALYRAAGGGWTAGTTDAQYLSRTPVSNLTEALSP